MLVKICKSLSLSVLLTGVNWPTIIKSNVGQFLIIAFKMIRELLR